ncbi:hypothetical protein [Pedobacter miscanthi]|jgi:hypothetical protein|uniref:hypothetical protein n=1 Tax=Pedobacter miscanthi TaxID=2259170 RepID=UPI00292EDD27|nr:hypothetical protein [Pedobacter miscanthi]
MKTSLTHIKNSLSVNINFKKALHVIALGLVILLSSSLTIFAQEGKAGKVNIGIIYPVSTNGTHAALDSNVFSLNLLVGVSAAEKGLSFAGLSNIIRKNAGGTQFAGFSNHIGGKAQGAQFAGFINTYGGGNGAAVAGFANIAKENSGMQISGFLNWAGKNVSAVQIGGFMNKAADVKGSQIAGFINIAKKVKGVQLAGFINIADSSDYPIGIINIVKNGEKSIALTTNQNLTTMATFRSGGKVLYGIIGAGYNFKNKDEVYAFEAGLGAHFFQSEHFRLNAELTGGSLQDFKRGNYFKSTFQLMPALRIGPHLEIFAGPSFNFISTNTEEGKTLQKHYVKTWDRKDNTLHGMFFGYTGGLAVSF